MTKTHTPGPWKIVTNFHPHYRGGNHTERRIFTAWEHPQLKDCYPIVNSSIGLGETADGPPRHMVSILNEADAVLIAAAPDLLDALQSLVDMDVAFQRGPKVENAVEKARAAIAKATGGAA